MATLVNTASNIEFNIAGYARGVIANIRAANTRHAEYKRIENELTNMSDRELADIGIARFDIAEIAKQHVAML